MTHYKKLLYILLLLLLNVVHLRFSVLVSVVLKVKHREFIICFLDCNL